MAIQVEINTENNIETPSHYLAQVANLLEQGGIIFPESGQIITSHNSESLFSEENGFEVYGIAGLPFREDLASRQSTQQRLALSFSNPTLDVNSHFFIVEPGFSSQIKDLVHFEIGRGTSSQQTQLRAIVDGAIVKSVESSRDPMHQFIIKLQQITENKFPGQNINIASVIGNLIDRNLIERNTLNAR